MKIKFTFEIQLIIFIILNILDAVLTYLVLSGKDHINELNPIYRNLFEVCGLTEGLIIIKTGGMFLITLVCYTLVNKENEHTLTKTFKYLNIFYVLIVINNLY